MAPPKKGIWADVTRSQVWKSIFRHSVLKDTRGRALAVLNNVFLHLHPVRIRKSGIAVGYTWCMGGLTLFLFLVVVFAGLVLMFDYRDWVVYEYMELVDIELPV